jgi:hypothetical protein
VWGTALVLALAVQRFAPPGVFGIALKLGVVAVFALSVVKLELWKEPATP